MTTPDERNHEARLAGTNERLRAVTDALGIPTARVVSLDERVAEVAAALPLDARPADNCCRICGGTIRPERRKRLSTGRIVHGICREMTDYVLLNMHEMVGGEFAERVLQEWLSVGLTDLRARVVIEHGFDPATLDPEEAATEYTGVITDADGIPTGIEHLTVQRSPIRPRPRLSWDLPRA